MSTPVVGCFRRRTRGVAARALDGVEEELVVVLAEHPRGVQSSAEQVGGDVVRRRRAGRRSASAGGPVGRLLHRTVVERRVGVERGGRDVGEHLAVEPVEDAEPARAGDGADDGGA